jgi:hypothetical protein
MEDTTLLYIAALLNRMTWRYNYGRKCFRQKLQNVLIYAPVTERDGQIWIDEQAIVAVFPKQFQDFLPKKTAPGPIDVPSLNWRSCCLTDFFTLQRGDFHSLSALTEGEFMTVSRVTEDNGVVGYYERPDGARLYSKGHITVSTVGGDSFVQLDHFIVTDNVLVCIPKRQFRITTLFFITFALNYQKWRYSYGRQCYKTKLERVNIYLPVNGNHEIDEDVIERIVKQTSYWEHIQRRFDTNHDLPEFVAS